MATNVPPLRFCLARGVGLIQILPPECQLSAQPVEIEIRKRAFSAVKISHGTFQNRPRPHQVASGRVMKSDRQLNQTLEMETEMLTVGAVEGHLTRNRAPHVLEHLMRVEKLGAVEQTDTAVDLCVVERHGYNGLAMIDCTTLFDILHVSID